MEPSLDVTSLHNRRAVHRWERTSVGDLLERITFSHPDKEATIAAEGAFADPRLRRLTYRQADELTSQVANGLLTRGLHRGDIVMMFCENSIEGILLKLGIARAGLVCAPINPMMAPDMVAAMIELVEPKLAVVDAELWPRARQTFTDHGLEVAITVTIGGDPVPGSVGFSDFVAGQSTDEPDVEIHGDDIWEILFTSGTTALPKAVMISHTCTYMAALGFAQSLTRGLRIENDLRLCTYLPMLYHVGDQPFLYSTFLSAGTLLIGRRPDAAAIARSIAGERLTALWAGSPAMVQAVDAAFGADDDLDATCLKVIVYGWAALPPATLESLKRHCGPELLALEIFGQTESIACHRFWPDKWPELYARTAPQQNYVGLPSPLLASVVMDPEGNDLAGQPGVAGEAVYRSPAIMSGYYRDEAATREAFRYGWFHSGDSCAYDDDGLRIMLDRYKDIIKSGGENVSSLRVEAVLNQHPDVDKAVVVGLPHARWGEAVTGVVLRRPGSKATAEEIIEFCRTILAGYETPKDILFADSLPETVGGKVLKYKLRGEYSHHFDGQLR
ncbi:class I adenylate-forming enzyme family protein [Streptomyces muensis]|uniref:AMP-binding protein n=1 Tax=Streptomyces muensis TaxID=1077944 RepID=A0A9X1TH37_STRM4|nr:AMP-binding protein [Streptomyces muensis]MCF1592316.1 AMP-binding protein [Streptomyces muensis]